MLRDQSDTFFPAPKPPPPIAGILYISVHCYTHYKLYKLKVAGLSCCNDRNILIFDVYSYTCVIVFTTEYSRELLTVFLIFTYRYFSLSIFLVYSPRAGFALLPIFACYSFVTSFWECDLLCVHSIYLCISLCSISWCSVVDPNTSNLDPDLDTGLCYQFSKKETKFVLNYKKIMSPEEIFIHLSLWIVNLCPKS